MNSYITKLNVSDITNIEVLKNQNDEIYYKGEHPKYGILYSFSKKFEDVWTQEDEKSSGK